ncbi:hypothetical protein R2F25_38275 [Streptomyces sp. UP1A-1]|nr:hypothetical protein [Streptomyces sp. UP1A-1]
MRPDGDGDGSSGGGLLARLRGLISGAQGEADRNPVNVPVRMRMPGRGRGLRMLGVGAIVSLLQPHGRAHRPVRRRADRPRLRRRPSGRCPRRDTWPDRRDRHRGDRHGGRFQGLRRRPQGVEQGAADARHRRQGHGGPAEEAQGGTGQALAVGP